MAIFENKWTPGQIIQIGMLGIGLTSLYYGGVSRIEALERQSARHERALDKVDDVNDRLIRIEEKVDQLRESRK